MSGAHRSGAGAADGGGGSLRGAAVRRAEAETRRPALHALRVVPVPGVPRARHALRARGGPGVRRRQDLPPRPHRRTRGAPRLHPPRGARTRRDRADAKGYMVVVNGYSVDAKGYMVVVNGYSVDDKGYMVVVKGYSVDAKGYMVVVNGYSVDAKGYM
eukprot:1182863-Prorocentrum_minimum.AAC.1